MPYFYFANFANNLEKGMRLLKAKRMRKETKNINAILPILVYASLINPKMKM